METMYSTGEIYEEHGGILSIEILDADGDPITVLTDPNHGQPIETMHAGLIARAESLLSHLNK